MRMGNPAMRKMVRKADGGELAVENRAATYGGITVKSIYFALMTILAAVLSVVLFERALVIESEKLLVAVIVAAVVSFVVMLVCAFVTMIAPSAVPFFGSLYCLAQGFLLGLGVYAIDLVLPGVALAAVLGTMIVFIVTVLLSKVLSVRIKSALLRVVMIGLISLFLVQMVMMIVGLVMGGTEGWFNAYFWIQLLASAFLVFYAAIVLMWDITSATHIVETGADKKYEWIVSYSLITTLVYLYIEILELLVRLAVLLGNNKK